LSANTADSASQLAERLVNDAQFRETIEAAPTLHDKAQVIRAAGYGDLSLDEIREALKERLAAVGAGVQLDPARVKRVEELFLKATSDQELQQALQAAATPEAKREVLAQAGYGDITLDDLRAAAADLAQREELSDAELELVSGGMSYAEQVGAGYAGGIAFGASAGFLIGMVGGPPGAAIGAAIGAGIGIIVGTINAIATAPPPSQW
jgi:predicted ribosomally synthesized peptide with nif11-like leader